MSGPVALFGVGLLGTAVARRLLAAGYVLRCCDRDPARVSAATALPAHSAPGAARGAAAALLCLPSVRDSRMLLLGKAGVAALLAPGAVVADLATGTPEAARSLARGLAPLGIHYLDAPITTGAPAVEAGAGAMVVGGSVAAVAQAAPLLRAVAPDLLHAGGPGAGAAAKLVSNLVLGLNRLALAEGLVLAAALGLPPEQALAVLGAGGAASRVLGAKGERLARRRYDAPDARLRQHLRDVELMLGQARRHGCRLPATALHRRLLRRACRMGYADADNSAVLEALLAPPRAKHAPPEVDDHVDAQHRAEEGGGVAPVA